MARREVAKQSGSSDVLVFGMIFILAGGFALFAFPDLFKGFGNGVGGVDAAKKAKSVNAMATFISTYVRNHLAKTTTWSLTQVVSKCKATFPSGLNTLAAITGYGTALPGNHSTFYKLYATIALRLAPQIPPAGQSLSSGALAAMTAMSKDGGKVHLTAMATSYPGLTEFELQNIAGDYGYQFSKNYEQYGRSFVGIAEDEDIVKKPANVEDYSEIPRDIEAV